MYDSIDLAELKRMTALAEATPENKFWMGEFWVRTSWCGTAGCLIGTWSQHTRRDRFEIRQSPDGGRVFLDGIEDRKNVTAISSRFGLTPLVAHFLFVSLSEWTHVPHECADAIDLSQGEAIARLRKYIRYVERKRALWAEHDWLMSLSRRDRLVRLNEKRRELVTV